MNIIVCVKQVTSTNKVNINKETNTIVREGVESMINPFDMYAIEEALRIRDKMGGSVTVLSMGIPSAADMLKEAIALGADDAVLLSDRDFAGADTLATSYSLSMAIKKIGDYHLIICGKQSMDGDTGQVGPSLAEKLGICHTTYVSKIEQISSGHIKCHRLNQDGYDVVSMTLPAVITVVKGINEPRLATIKGIMRAKKVPVKVWTVNDIQADKSLCGLKGSPTRVVKTYVPEYDIKSEIISGASTQEKAKKIVDKLISVLPSEYSGG